MNKILKIFFGISIVIFLSKIIDTYIYHSPIEISNRLADTLYLILFLISIVFIGFIIVFYFLKKKSFLYHFLSILALIMLIITSLPIFILGLENTLPNEEKIILQSLDNKNEQIVYQYFDDGAIGSHCKWVKIKKFPLGVRYIEPINKSKLKGKWIFNKNNRKDTIEIRNFDINKIYYK